MRARYSIFITWIQKGEFCPRGGGATAPTVRARKSALHRSHTPRRRASHGVPRTAPHSWRHRPWWHRLYWHESKLHQPYWHRPNWHTGHTAVGVTSTTAVSTTVAPVVQAAFAVVPPLATIIRGGSVRFHFTATPSGGTVRSCTVHCPWQHRLRRHSRTTRGTVRGGGVRQSQLPGGQINRGRAATGRLGGVPGGGGGVGSTGGRGRRSVFLALGPRCGGV